MRLPVDSQKRNQDKLGYFDYVPYNENQIKGINQREPVRSLAARLVRRKTRVTKSRLITVLNLIG